MGMKRKLLGCGAVFFAIAVAVFAIYVSSGYRMVSRIEAAIDEADSVVLERFSYGGVKDSKEISPEDLRKWVSEDLTSRPPLPFDVSFCWRPHH